MLLALCRLALHGVFVFRPPPGGGSPRGRCGEEHKWRSIEHGRRDTETDAKLRTNLDTNFLKLFAILTMVVDHVGTVFFPQHPEFRWVGRLAFPIFCYCLTVGLMYTRDIRRYLGRLALFAVVSQPFFVLAFHPHNFWEELTSWNIFVTLFFSLLAIYGVKERKWWWFLLGVLAINVLNADYANTGVILTLIFYLCRNKPWLGALLYVLSYLPALWGGSLEDPMALVVGGHAIGFEIFALLSAPLIFLPTHFGPKIPKWFFYAFYPGHLLVIFLVRTALGI